MPAADAGNTISANVLTTDSAESPLSVNSIFISTITVQATTTTSTTTTIPPASGGGGGGGGSGGGGIHKPTITKTSYGYNVTSIAQLNTFFVNMCGMSSIVTENFISPTDAGITINSNSYTLYLNQSVNIAGTACYVKLNNISWIPLQQTIDLVFINKTVSNVNATSTIISTSTTTSTSSTTMPSTTLAVPSYQLSKINKNEAIGALNLSYGKNIISVPFAKTYFLIYTDSLNKSLMLITVKNITNKLMPPAGEYNILELNVSMESSANLSISVNTTYNCAIPASEIMPSILLNNTWSQVQYYSINSDECSISFRTGRIKSFVVGIFLKPTLNQEAINNAIKVNNAKIAVDIYTFVGLFTLALFTAARSSRYHRSKYNEHQAKRLKRIKSRIDEL